MVDFTLKDVLEDVYQSEFSRFDDLSALPDPQPPLRHRLRMSGIFRRFNRKVNKLYAPKLRFNRRMLLVYLTIILLALTACAAAKIIGDFIYEKYEDNTELFALNVEGAPTVIEEVYDIAVVPEGYYAVSTILTRTQHIIGYSDISSDKTIVLRQSTKANFNIHYNTEGHAFEKTTVNGLPALFIDFSEDDYVGGSVIWDNGDYIFEVNGDMPKNDVIKLAENVKAE